MEECGPCPVFASFTSFYLSYSDGHLHRRYFMSFLMFHNFHYSLFLLFVRKVPGYNSIHFSVSLYEIFLGHFTKIPKWNIDKIILAGNTDVLGNKPVPLSLIPSLTQHTLIWDRSRTSATTDLRLTTFLRNKCLFIAPFRITKDYTFNR